MKAARRVLAALAAAAAWAGAADNQRTVQKVVNPASASGGAVTRYIEGGANWVAHTFTNGGTLTVTTGGEIEYLVVAGGGGGGAPIQGGGGGAGGFLTGVFSLTSGAYRITIGAGGRGFGRPGGISKGGDSSIEGTGIIAYGGGSGAGESLNATNGGSGGGGAWSGACGHGFEGPPRQGYDGGAAGVMAGSGGGGAGGAGTNAVNDRNAGGGGPGRASTMRDGVSAVVYAAGGNGQRRIDPRTDGADKADNTGHGGDGGGDPVTYKSLGGNGGSGIVIVRHRTGILNRPVSNLTTNGATFNGWLLGTGGLPTAVGLRWGESNGAWAHTNWWNAGAWGDNSWPSIVISLTPDRHYNYSFIVSNALANAADAPECFITGAVDVRVTRRESTEEKPAAFVISRPATATNGPLAVHFTLGGTGRNGEDYEPLESPAIIPAGAAEIRLPVAPNFNMGETRSKGVELTLAPGGYLIGPNSKASMVTKPQ